MFGTERSHSYNWSQDTEFSIVTEYGYKKERVCQGISSFYCCLICDKFIDQFLSYGRLWCVQLSPSVITGLILNWPDDPQFLDWTISFIQTSVVHTPKGKRIATGKDFKGKSIFASHRFLISTAPHELLISESGFFPGTAYSQPKFESPSSSYKRN